MKTKQSFIRIILFPVMLFTLVLVSSCKKSDDTTTAVAALNVVNAVAATTTINFNLNGTLVSGPVLPYANPTGYFTIYTGLQKIDIIASNTTPVLATANVDAETNGYYSVFFIGSGTPYSAITVQDNTTAPAAGKVKLRFINLSPDAPALNLTTSTGTVLASNIAYKDYADYVSIDAGTYTLQLKNATGGNVLVSSSKPFEAGKIYTVFASGLTTGSNTTALAIQSYQIIP